MTGTKPYKGQWRPRFNCDCKTDGKPKISYRDEAQALAAAGRLGVRFDTTLRAYKCPGGRRWHLASRGFHTWTTRGRRT